MEVFLTILQFTLPALVVFGITYFMFKEFLKREVNLKKVEMDMLNRKDTLPLRLQAYERLTLFLERISLDNLVKRIMQPGLAMKQFQLELVTSIREEFEHNMSQQVYVSKECWQAVVLSKDDTIKTINLISTSLSAESTASDLSKAIFEYMIKTNDLLSTQKALDSVNSEAKSLLV